MNRDYATTDRGTGDCKVLMESSTPHVYLRSAFRITGLPTDVSLRDLKRRVDELKHAAELGDIDDDHSHAYALTPPPSLDLIQDAAQILQDPERRIVQELYWFWPLEWGAGKTDPALVALGKKNKTAAYNIWKQEATGGAEARKLVSKHNLAVLYHLVVLDGEVANLDKEISEEGLKQLDKYWKASFQYWEELVNVDQFWKLVADRVLSIGDPRLTTEFCLSLRRTLPKALHQINGQLAMLHVEKGRVDRAGKHAEYIADTYKGLDAISDIFDLITKPHQARIRDAVAIAKNVAESQPLKAADAATDLFKTVAKPFVLIEQFLSNKDHRFIDLRDAVADAGLSCYKAFSREQKDWERCRSILDSAKAFAISDDVRARLDEAQLYVEGTVYLDPIYKLCEEVSDAAKSSPVNGLYEGKRLLALARPLLTKLETADIAVRHKNRAKDEVAGTLMQCAIVDGKDLKGSVELLKTALTFAADSELKDLINQKYQIYQVFEICNQVGTTFNDSPDDALSECNRLLTVVPALISALQESGASSEILNRAKDEVAGTLAQGAIAYGNKTEDWKDSLSLLETALKYALDPKLKEYINRNLQTGRQNWIAQQGGRTAGQNAWQAPSSSPSSNNWKGFVAVFGIIVFLFIVIGSNNSSSNRSTTYSPSSAPSRNTATSNPQYNATPSQQYDARPSRASLRSEIEDEKRRAKDMETQLQQMDAEIDGYSRQLDLYKATEMYEAHNMLVPTYNDLVRRRQSLYRQYSQLVNEINSKVNQYNAR